MKTAEELARDHWEWHRRFLKEVAHLSDSTLHELGRVAIDYFIHGFKHGEKK